MTQQVCSEWMPLQKQMLHPGNLDFVYKTFLADQFEGLLIQEIRLATLIWRISHF